MDRIVLEFRSILAETTHRSQVKTHPDFHNQVLLKKDFRDEFLIGTTEINKNAIIEYILNLFYPVQFKSTESLQPAEPKDNFIFRFSYNPRQYEKYSLDEYLLESSEHFTEWISNFFKHTLKLSLELKKNKDGIFSKRMIYRKTSSSSLVDFNKKKREQLISYLKSRGHTSLLDYIKTYGLDEKININTIKSDGTFNLFPGHQGGPSPRVGGGDP